MRVQFTPLSYLDIAEEEMPVLTLSERVAYWRRHLPNDNCRAAEEEMLKLAKCTQAEIERHMADFDAEWAIQVARC